MSKFYFRYKKANSWLSMLKDFLTLSVCNGLAKKKKKKNSQHAQALTLTEG